MSNSENRNSGFTILCFVGVLIGSAIFSLVDGIGGLVCGGFIFVISCLAAAMNME